MTLVRPARCRPSRRSPSSSRCSRAASSISSCAPSSSSASRSRARAAARCASRRASIPTRPDLHLGHAVLLQKMRRVPGPRAHGHLPHRRLHGDGGRPDRPEREPPAPHARRGRPLGRDVPRPGVQGPRPREGRAAAQQRVARRDDDGRRRRADGQVDRVAHARAQGLPPALRRASAPSTSTSFSTRSCRATTRSSSSATSSSAGPTSSST